MFLTELKCRRPDSRSTGQRFGFSLDIVSCVAMATVCWCVFSVWGCHKRKIQWVWMTPSGLVHTRNSAVLPRVGQDTSWTLLDFPDRMLPGLSWTLLAGYLLDSCCMFFSVNGLWRRLKQSGNNRTDSGCQRSSLQLNWSRMLTDLVVINETFFEWSSCYFSSSSSSSSLIFLILAVYSERLSSVFLPRVFFEPVFDP